MDDQPVGEPVTRAPRSAACRISRSRTRSSGSGRSSRMRPTSWRSWIASGVVKYVSPSVEPLLGYSPKELVGQRFAPLSDVDAVALNRTLDEQPGVPIFMEGGLRHRDGRLRAFEGSVTNLLDDPVVQGLRRQRSRCHRPSRSRGGARGAARWRCARSCRRRRSRSSRSIARATCTSGTSRARSRSAGPRPRSSVVRRRSTTRSSISNRSSRARSTGRRSPATKRASRVATVSAST